MPRYLADYIKKDVGRKLCLLSGPRQVGKTTFARTFFDESTAYLNYDSVNDRKIILKSAWDRKASLVILDELHKFPKWKNFLKGIIDEQRNEPPILVTGSARLEIFRKAGDALTGRTFHYRLHPIDVGEAIQMESGLSEQIALERLMKTGGFPESYFNPELAPRLLLDRLDVVLKEDLRDISNVLAIKTVELLVQLLRERISGQIKYSNLASDLSVSPITIKKWIELLEKLYVVFLLPPYSRKLAKSIRKEPKLYFFDCCAAMKDDVGARFENLVACSLLKYCHLQRDALGRQLSLFYYRDVEHREVDFVLTEGSRVLALIEAKANDADPSKSLLYLSERLKPTHALQLVQGLDKNMSYKSVRIVDAARWLKKIEM